MALSEHEQRQFDLLTNGFLEENPEIAKQVKKAAKIRPTAEKGLASPASVWRVVQFMMAVGIACLVLGLFTTNGGLTMMGMPFALIGFTTWMFLPAHYKQKKGATAKTKSPFMERLENAWDQRTKGTNS